MGSGTGIKALRINEKLKLVTGGKYGGRGDLLNYFSAHIGFGTPSRFRGIQTREQWRKICVLVLF